MKPAPVDLRALVAALEADPDLAARFARAIAPFVFQAAVAASKTPSKTYSTRAGGAPEGYSRESWRAIAHKIGTRRGRYVFVSQAELDAFERDRDAKPVGQAPANDDAPSSTPWHPSMAASALGLRPTRGSR
jgi:hypothetical protein